MDLGTLIVVILIVGFIVSGVWGVIWAMRKK
jgi:hypothetical protein